MSPELSAWLAQVPWGPLGIVAVVVVLWLFTQAGGKKKRAALAAKLESGAHVIDVRSKAEFAGGHYPGAVNIPVDTLGGQTKKLGAVDRPLVVYCASGGRSSQAASILRSAGFTDVTDAGGMGNMPTV
jgi:phage shock protein E